MCVCSSCPEAVAVPRLLTQSFTERQIVYMCVNVLKVRRTSNTAVQLRVTVKQKTSEFFIPIVIAEFLGKEFAMKNTPAEARGDIEWTVL